MNAPGTPSNPPPPHLPPKPARPEEVIAGRYRLGALIGRGGMATIHEATDLETGRMIALKRLRPEIAADRDLAHRFRREALAATVLRHPNIVACLGAGTDDGLPFLIMELVDGEDLAARLRREGPQTPWQVVRIGLDVARALGVAHLRGIVHRDIKPGNILLAADGRAMVADFGIARLAMDAEGAVPGTTLGSVQYFSPEQARGTTTTPASDVYGLGLVMYEALTGRRAWSGATSDAVALARVGATAPSPRAVRPEIPAALDAVVRRALAPEAADRFPNGTTMAAALESIAASVDPSTPGMPVGAVGRRPARPPRLRRPRLRPPRLRRGRVRPGARVGLLVVIGLVVGALLVAALPGAAGLSTPRRPAPSVVAAAPSQLASTRRPSVRPSPASTTSPSPSAPDRTTSPVPTRRPTNGAGAPDVCEIFFEIPCGLTEGRYSPSRFRPPIEIALGPGWALATHAADRVTLTRDEGRLILVSGVTDVFRNGEVETTPGRARDLIESFTITKGLSATRPVRVRIDGRRGWSVDLTPAGPDGPDSPGGADPVPLFAIDGATYALEPGRTVRLVAIDDADTTLVLVIEPSADRTIEEILDTADAVAGSVRYR